MKVLKIILCSALLVLPALGSGEGATLFGIPIGNSSSEELLQNVVYNLAMGNRNQARADYDMLRKVEPDLGKLVDLDALKIPCIACKAGEVPSPNGRCSACRGRKEIVDPAAMAYLLNKLQGLIEEDDGTNLEKAWKAALKEFEIRKSLILKSVPFAGEILAKDENGCLLKLEEGKVIFLVGFGETIEHEAGEALAGNMWPMGKQTYIIKKPRVVRAKKCTLSIWMDF